MFALPADTFMIRQRAIRKTASHQALHSKIYPMIGPARLAVSERNTSKSGADSQRHESPHFSCLWEPFLMFKGTKPIGFCAFETSTDKSLLLIEELCRIFVVEAGKTEIVTMSGSKHSLM